MQYFLGTENVPMDIYAQVRPYKGKNDLVGYADFHLDNAVWIRDCRIYQKDPEAEPKIIAPSYTQQARDSDKPVPHYYATFEDPLYKEMQKTVQEALQSEKHRAQRNMDCGKLFYQPVVKETQGGRTLGRAHMEVTAKEGDLKLFSVNSMLIKQIDDRAFLSMPARKVEKNGTTEYRECIQLDSPNYFQQNLILHEAQVKGLLPERADKDKSKEDMER